MSLLISTLQAFCESSRPLAWEREVRIKSGAGHFPGLPAWERKVRQISMINKNAHWAGDFAMQRRSLLLMRARNVCRNASDAEDLVQETILRFIQGFGSVVVPPDPRDCEAWMMRTLRNLFIDQCRKRQVQEKGAKEPGMSSEVAPSQELVGDASYDRITPEQLAEALEALSPKLRETLKLHLSGKKYHEIAKILGIPEGTVGKRIHDARAKLNEQLKHLLPSKDDLS